MRKVFILAVLAGSGFAGPAHADQAGWCAAYARDFADSHAADKVLWQHKYDIAQKSCLDNEVAGAPVADVAKKPEASVVPAKKVEPQPVKVEAIPAANPVAKVATPEPAVPAKIKAASGAPEVGSAEWNAYCAKKYSSFDAKTGTYQSLTGVKRKCLYTG